MIALDANVLLRLIVRDDPQQVGVASGLIENEPCFVPLTVTLECEWVLRSYYRYTPVQIADAIDALTDVGQIVFECVDGVRWALDRLVAGADFADMIHMVQSHTAEAEMFATFDTGVADEAGHSPPLPVRALA